MRFAIFAVFATLASPAAAEGLFDTTGAFVGEGQLAISPSAALERGRCRVEVTPGEGALDVIGSCAVAVGKSDLSMKLVRGEAGRLNAGVWTQISAQTVQYAGVEAGGRVVMEATTPLMVEGRAYDTRVELDETEAGFTLRQLIRPQGAEAWAVVVDMDYRPAG